MFETVAPETLEARSKLILYESLPLSIALHAAGIAAALVLAVWNVAFPIQSPRLVRAYSIATIPDPPPPPPLPQTRQPVPKHEEVPPPPPEKMVAPTVIPDSIPSLPAPAAPPELAPAPPA